MSSFLTKVQTATMEAIEARRSQRINFEEELRRAPTPVIIAEFKKESPSLGELNLSVDSGELSKKYFSVGATAVSVLTEERFFKGSLEDLRKVRAENPEGAILQKDFILDEFQIYEAKFFGADCILLIVALLGPEKTKKFFELSKHLGLSSLIEVHTEEELEVALEVGGKLIGVNNRNLGSLEISLETSRQLIKRIPKDVFAISESGISTANEIRELMSLGFRGFLIGSSLMKHKNPEEKLAELMKEAQV